jgi:hypothetical protein
MDSEIKPIASKEAARQSFVNAVTNYLDECEQEDGFNGFQIMESRNKETNQLLSISFIPVDKIGDITAPRA